MEFTAKITNIVCQAKFNVNINLKEFIHTLNYAKYNPSRFSAICWNHGTIQASLLLFNNGRVVLHGCKTMQQARVCIRQYARLVQKRGYKVKISDFKLVTASLVCDVRHRVDLIKLSTEYPGCSFEPELFNAAVFKKNSTIHFSVFASGKIVVTGIKKLSLISELVLPTLLDVSMY